MKRFVVLGMAASCAAVAVQAQTVNSQCAAQTQAVQDACQKAVDFFQYMAPQLGVAMTGGNATLGQGGALGGLGHVVVSVRGNLLQGSVPQIDKITTSTSGAQQSTIPTKSQILGLPQADAAIGLFKGIPLGVTNVGGVDLLVSAAYLPSVNSNSVKVSEPDGSLKFGFGARVGLIQESLVSPGVSVTYLRRDLPTVDIASSSSNGDSLLVNGLDLQTTAWRIVASKSLMLFGLAAGVGQDQYSSSTAIRAHVASVDSTAGPIDLSQKMTRTNYFFDLSLNFPLIKLVGEIGEVTGGSVSTYNTFSGTKADASRMYGSAGLRIGF